MRIVFCGSGPFAGPSLAAIVQAGHQVVRVVTQPAKPAGRGAKVQATPLAQAASALGLSAVETPDINAADSVAAIAACQPDVIVVADFGQFVRAAVRATAPLGSFNLHGSLLPELRGAAPVAWAIIRGYEKTGVTTFALVDKMDAGAIYLQAATDIRPTETAEELRMRLAGIGATLVVQTLDLLAKGAAQGQPQDESKATLAPRLDKEIGWIDWSADARTIRNLIHGVWPWPGAHTILQRATGQPMPVLISRAAVEPGASGQPCVLDKDMLVGTGGGGRIRIIEIQPAGKRVMDWRAFVNGYRPAAGDRFIGRPT